MSGSEGPFSTSAGPGAGRNAVSDPTSGPECGTGAAGGTIPAANGLFRRLFDSMREGCAYNRVIFEAGRAVDWIYLDVNPAFTQLTGLSNVIGRRVTEVIPGFREDHAQVLEVYGRVAMTGEPERLEVHVLGLGRWFSLSLFRPETGCAAAVFENITARMQAEAAMRQSESFVRSTLDSLDSHIAVVGESGEILSVNEAWRRFGEENGGARGVPAASA